jgi:hypothetical protein
MRGQQLSARLRVREIPSNPSGEGFLTKGVKRKEGEVSPYAPQNCGATLSAGGCPPQRPPCVIIALFTVKAKAETACGGDYLLSKARHGGACGT